MAGQPGRTIPLNRFTTDGLKDGLELGSGPAPAPKLGLATRLVVGNEVFQVLLEQRFRRIAQKRGDQNHFPSVVNPGT